MSTTQTFVMIWRGLNVTMGCLCLIQLIVDVAQRRRLHLRARFYWEAVALMIISIIWSTTEAIIHPPASWVPSRTAVVTVSLIYFLISTYRSGRVRRLELAQRHDDGLT